jgi:outer membrane lipoprotein-sorting protein
MMRWRIRLGLLVLLPCGAFAQTQTDVADILKKVGETYQAASEYELVVDFTPHEGAVTDGAMHALFAFKPPNKYRAEGRWPGMGMGPGDSVAVHDGVNLWFYMPKENQYGSISGDKLTPDAPGDLGDASPEFMNLALQSGFARMANQAKNGKLLREESIVVGGSSASCYVIQGQIDGHDGTLWVDKNRFVILRADTAEGKMVFTTIKLNEPLPDDLFKFTPPPGAKKVEIPQ